MGKRKDTDDDPDARYGFSSRINFSKDVEENPEVSGVWVHLLTGTKFRKHGGGAPQDLGPGDESDWTWRTRDASIEPPEPGAYLELARGARRIVLRVDSVACVPGRLTTGTVTCYSSAE